MPTVLVYNDVWQQQQRPSLLIVVGSGPTYNPATDVFRAKQAQFFPIDPDFLQAQRALSAQPGGPVGYSVDFRSFQAKYFPPEDTFIQQYGARPRLTTDFFQSSDIFAGHDVYGWPESPEPPTFFKETRGTRLALQAFVPYNPANDMFLLRPQQKVFVPEDIQWTGAKPFARGSIDIFQTYLDTPRIAKFSIFFGEYQTQWDFQQKPTQNALFAINVYNPATDIIFRRPQDKTMVPPETFFNISQRVGINAVTIIPPPYNPGTDVVLFRSQDKTATPDLVWSVQMVGTRVAWDVTQIIPPPAPGVITLFNWQGRVILSPNKVGEQIFVPVDFISRLAAGETIVAASCTSTLYSGTDPNPGAMLIGAPTVTGSVIEQEVGPILSGNTYELAYVATTSLGQVLKLSGYYTIVPDLP